MAPEPFTTIVIPTFNREKLLERAIRSALNQTVGCEVIVVDHGSSKGTSQVVKSFGRKVQYLRREKDDGPVFSWLDGAIRAQTPAVKLLYDDDYLEPKFLEATEPFLRNEVGFVFTKAYLRRLSDNILLDTLFMYESFETGVYAANSLFGHRVARIMISPTALLIRKSDLIDGLHAGSLPFQKSSFHGAGADHFVKLLALVRYPRLAFVNEPLCTFGHHPSSITVGAQESSVKQQQLTNVYGEVYRYFVFLKVTRALFTVLSVFVDGKLFQIMKKVMVSLRYRKIRHERT